MIALDTNILVRLLLKDDVAQFKQAHELLSRSEIYTAPITVMLELVWVLETEDFSRDQILQSLRTLLGLPNFKPKSFEAVCQAIKWYEAGMDFGDAMHLALSAGDEVFVSFDKVFCKIATQHDTAPAVQVLRRSAK
ncbi:MAG: type II toxin-antitoxin system VapC family toxin [Gallionella sp.]|nr:type II toxin-antitoxin system VapC family toxin [Gallionella sp.]